jgi:hypothetical protein
MSLLQIDDPSAQIAGWATMAPFATPPTPLAAPNGGASYTIGDGTPFVPTNPAASFYFVNGIKRQYGAYYTISGSTLSYEPGITPPQTGDSHEIYCT